MTASEADAGEALWRRLTVPEKERRKLLDAYRNAVLHAAAERQRDGDGARIEYGEPICNCPDLIDPAKQEQP